MDTTTNDGQLAVAGTGTSAPALAGAGGFVTIKEAARLLGMSVWGVHSAVRRHRVPKVKLGNSVLLKVSDLHLVRN